MCAPTFWPRMLYVATILERQRCSLRKVSEDVRGQLRRVQISMNKSSHEKLSYAAKPKSLAPPWGLRKYLPKLFAKSVVASFIRSLLENTKQLWPRTKVVMIPLT